MAYDELIPPRPMLSISLLAQPIQLILNQAHFTSLASIRSRRVHFTVTAGCTWCPSQRAVTSTMKPTGSERSR